MRDTTKSSTEIAAILSAVRSGRVYTSEIGPFLDALRALTRNEDIREVAVAVSLFESKAAQANTRSVYDALPALIVNHLPAFQRAISAQNFARWEQKNREWAKQLRAAAGRPSAFEGFIEAWLAELAEFEAEHPGLRPA